MANLDGDSMEEDKLEKNFKDLSYFALKNCASNVKVFSLQTSIPARKSAIKCHKS